MIEEKNTFQMAYLSRWIGYHFSGLDLLLGVRALFKDKPLLLLEQELQRWSSYGPHVVSQVQCVEGLLTKATLQIPQPPTSQQEYVSWVQTIDAQMKQYFSDQMNAPAQELAQIIAFKHKWLFAISSELGDFIHNARLLVLALRLMEGNSISLLQKQTLSGYEQLDKNVSRLLDLLQRTKSLQSFEDNIQNKFETLVSTMDKVSDLKSSGSAAEWLTSLIAEVSSMLPYPGEVT